MFGFIKNILGGGPKVDLRALVKEEKAKIVDVRTPGEFKSGHIRGSVNIPLTQIQNAGRKFKADQPLVLVCASGMRSGQARRMLKSVGFTNVHNGGGWQSFQNQIR